ncbi:MAG: TetR/AcrR family transcriptional regulator [Spirochaetales bacterium]|nr:TetR/AcrR family transcriptional regulator [Spirochaetales bacterium]
MKKTFHNLPQERQEEILNIAMKEFIAHGYEQASINNIIKELKIAKGSFYNYTASKENLYLYIFDKIYEYSFKIQNNPTTYKTDDLFDRAEELTRFSMEYCREHPLEYKVLLRSELDLTSSLYPKMIALKKQYSDESLAVLFGNVNWDLYDLESKEDIIAIFTWLVQGVRNDLNTRVNANMNVDQYETIMNSRLKLFKDSITVGIYKKNLRRKK